ncbi:hypothetical protein T12_3474 [Trichinella patagoniensis]|uniref:Peptidase aspartic putative domain-containing protein n=1 Tax=Trichinella patagoniensis TaxID=990121 RepID=A0A0V0Z638_9BILA|nr:hypothetical protein T12_3474 [Trichinella patagoniensis]
MTGTMLCEDPWQTRVSPSDWPHFQNLKLMKEVRELTPVHVINGLDSYFRFLGRQVIHGGDDDPVAVETLLGWMICGPATSLSRERKCYFHRINVVPISLRDVPAGHQRKAEVSNSVRRIGGALRNLSERSFGGRTESPHRTNGNPAAVLSLLGWTKGRHRKDVVAGGSSPRRYGRLQVPLGRCERRECSKGVSGVVGYDEALPFRKDRKPEGRLWKTLDILWDTNSHRLSFQQPEVDKEAQDTKRILLRLAATAFDPLRYLTLFTVQAKMLLQLLWQEGTSWDDTLSVAVAAVWRTWKGELVNLSQFSIDRACIQCSFMEFAHMDLHCFADASGSAYGAVIYLRLVHGSGKVGVRFLAAKSMVASIKKLSLPWSCFCWSDSSVVLCWKRSDAERLKPFVSNPVRDIQQITSPDWWDHCPTQDTPGGFGPRWPQLDESAGTAWSGCQFAEIMIFRAMGSLLYRVDLT